MLASAFLARRAVLAQSSSSSVSSSVSSSLLVPRRLQSTDAQSPADLNQIYQNRVTLRGYVARDPTTFTFPSGNKIAQFAVKTMSSYKDAEGVTHELPQYHNVRVTPEQLVEAVSTRVQKGAYLYLEGALNTRKWEDKEGITRYRTEVVVNRGGKLSLLRAEQHEGVAGQM